MPLLHGISDFPAQLTFPDSQKWARKKPFPAPGCAVSVGGFLHRVKRSGRENNIEAFLIDITNIAYITERKQPRDDSFTTSQSGPSSSRTRFDYQAKKTPTKRVHPQDDYAQDNDTNTPPSKKPKVEDKDCVQVEKGRETTHKSKSPNAAN